MFSHLGNDIEEAMDMYSLFAFVLQNLGSPPPSEASFDKLLIKLTEDGILQSESWQSYRDEFYRCKYLCKIIPRTHGNTIWVNKVMQSFLTARFLRKINEISFVKGKKLLQKCHFDWKDPVLLTNSQWRDSLYFLLMKTSISFIADLCGWNLSHIDQESKNGNGLAHLVLMSYDNLHIFLESSWHLNDIYMFNGCF
jgi:hypothetical protein